MSYYAELDNAQKSGGDIATTSGWGDFRRWVESLPDDTPELDHLVVHGWCQELDDLASELTSAIETGGTASVIGTANGLLQMLEARAEAEVIVVTDGAGVEANA